MPILETIGSAIVANAGKILSCCCGMCQACMNTKKQGLMIPFLKTSLKNNLVSDSIVFVDLDAEIKQSLDEDDAKLDPDSHLFFARMFNQAKKIVEEIVEINLTSKKLNEIVFISSEYKILKFCDCDDGGIDYFIPTDSLHEELTKAPNWDEVKYQKIKAGLMDNKKSKLQTYSSLNDLLQQIIEIYPEANVKI